MVQRATDADYAHDMAEEWIEYINKGTLTANKPTTVITRKADAKEWYVVEEVGTNGGYNITMQIKNKNDQIGEDIPGVIAPLKPADERHKIRVPYRFVSGDEFNLVATAASAAYNTKFIVRGFKMDRSGL